MKESEILQTARSSFFSQLLAMEARTTIRCLSYVVEYNPPRGYVRVYGKPGSVAAIVEELGRDTSYPIPHTSGFWGDPGPPNWVSFDVDGWSIHVYDMNEEFVVVEV
jgi:hypothetical protein